MHPSVQAAPRGSYRPARRSAFTLIEMLVSLAITLIMMGAVVTLFGVVTDSVSGSRSLLEISDKLRATRNRLQADLQGATATMKPPLRPENGEGYLEVIEGQDWDGNNKFNNTAPPINTLFGDTDDALMLTVRSRGEPFVGMFNGITAESQVAEVVYFLGRSGTEAIIDATANDPVTGNPPLRLFTLYRRALLVLPQAPVPAVTATFYNSYDVSARYDSTAGTLFFNSLGDLTKRENRFAHLGSVYPTPFPFVVSSNPTPPPSYPLTSGATLSPFNAASGRLGDDIIMTNVLSFDVQVYDPGAPVFVSNGTSVEPRDQGYRALLTPGPPSAAGAYTDLGYLLGTSYTPPGGYPAPLFGGSPDARSGIPSARTVTNPYVYDTWSLHYENDGVDQNGDGVADAATNGLDDGSPGDGIVDDIGERDTMPPYSAQLRGLRVTIRVYEPNSQQVRQMTVVQDFLPD
jgi:prepilin-type N-terminal cleavage/methylation domain-containing protein